jgi:hypothetical protein
VPNRLAQAFDLVGTGIYYVTVILAGLKTREMPQPLNDVALAGHALHSHFMRSMIAIAFDNSSRAALSDAA